ncbi:hypothetical protein SAMN04487995_0332 [Dyadobacter koreensis]|uniref:DUF6965 domain-containing protein n=1 Tax=Dyadobacter koreensis TaxID=408657 RepID=A0A1H6QE47_9BACT|nr:hypothetical protein [Dyadobacter koreensis]SEI39214.1 hypothetical protein SAMN04487995_0332 [Dyadobacter koreensis]
MNATETELQELLTFFKTAKLPQVPFKLNKYITVVNDVQRFIDSEARAIRDYRGSEIVHDSLLKHLRELKGIVQVDLEAK